jgi:hypothetical protein
MNQVVREKRLTYLALAYEVDTTLCAWCKYCHGSACDNSGCEHPLGDWLPENNNSYGMEPGMDCWAFRPSHPIDIIADIVGILLENKWQEWFYQEKKDGVIIVRGNP